MKKICALLDKDEQYAYRFMNYVNDKRLMPYEVVMFTQKALLEEYIKETRVELLLASEVVENKEKFGENVGTIIKLSEENGEDQECVYKYQSMDALVKEIMCKIGRRNPEGRLTGIGVKARVYGVYSPVGRNYKTTLALALAQCAARNQRTLYLNLEEFCGIEVLIDDMGSNMSELLYYFRNNKDRLAARIGQGVRTLAGFDYIPVCATPEDYEEVMPQEWVEFFRFLISNGDYETVVIDIGNVVHESWKIIDLCQTVYMPVVKDLIGKGKEKRFREYMQLLGRMDLLEKLQSVEIPYDSELLEMEDISKIQWGAVGELARRLLYG